MTSAPSSLMAEPPSMTPSGGSGAAAATSMTVYAYPDPSVGSVWSYRADLGGWIVRPMPTRRFDSTVIVDRVEDAARRAETARDGFGSSDGALPVPDKGAPQPASLPPSREDDEEPPPLPPFRDFATISLLPPGGQGAEFSL